MPQQQTPIFCYSIISRAVAPVIVRWSEFLWTVPGRFRQGSRTVRTILPFSGVPRSAARAFQRF